MTYAHQLGPEGIPGYLPVQFRPFGVAATISASNASLPSITGSNPGTRAASLAFHRHACSTPATVAGIRLGIVAMPSPSTIRIKAAIYAASEANGLPTSVLDPLLVSTDVAFSSNVATAGDRYLDLPFAAATRIGKAQSLWIAVMCEAFYTVTDTTLGSLRGTVLRSAVCGTAGAYFDRDLAYVGAGVSTIASGFPSGIGTASNFANSADGTLGNAACGLLCLP